MKLPTNISERSAFWFSFLAGLFGAGWTLIAVSTLIRTLWP